MEDKVSHQCVHCGKMYPDASKELLEGCQCGSHFFFFIRQEQLEKAEEQVELDLTTEDKQIIEKDVREMIGVEEEAPVILDLESIRILKPGKFEIDVRRLFDKKRPLVYKLEEGKYIIDLASTLEISLDELRKKIKKPK